MIDVSNIQPAPIGRGKRPVRPYKDELLRMPAVAYTDPRSVIASFRFYFDEHVRPKGSDLSRLAAAADNICHFFGAERDITTIKAADMRGYIAHRTAQGVTGATIRRELTWLRAAWHHGHREERLTAPGKLRLPANSPPRTRFLTEAEVARVMAQPMPYRIRMFFRLAFATGARARAIEELEWSRVDFTNGIIDYNVPGARRHNKRRAILPISVELRRVLEAAFARPGRDPADPYVIGAGKRGGPSSTGAQCKAVMVAAGINEVGVCRHVARKTLASHMLQNGVALAKVSAVLADRPTTVEKSYAFILPEHLREAVNFRRGPK